MTPTPPAAVPSRNEEQASMPADGQALKRSREVRLGLVLYGGVSLAIYINGVANEFFRAVRGRGVYRLIKALTDSEVAVDIISGTSAGGINGIFLAFCLCNKGSEFGRSALLWREHGDIRALLRSADDKNAFLSLLNSEGYYLPKLEEALAAMYSPPASDERSEDPSLETPSLVNELDLFITGTDVDGNISTRFDDAGHPIDIKDYRSVFLLKHREGRKRPFLPRKPEAAAKDLQSDVTVKALAKLAYITSCFPSAFSPVQVPLGNGDASRSNGAQEDAELQKWGRLARESNRCFLDGGVLDNKPFSYTLRAIFSRHALCEVDRKLCYIEPVPESFKPPAQASQPDILNAVIASLIGIPRYESISEDLKMLADHNSRVHQYNRILSELQSQSGDELAAQVGSKEPQVLYRRSRLVALSERVLQGIFRVEGSDAPISLLEPDLRQRAAALVRCFDEVEIDVDHIFNDLDVTFRLRRLYHTVYRLHDRLYKDNDAVPREHVPHYQKLWHVLNRQIELHEILQEAMEALIDQAQFNWRNFDVTKSREQARELWLAVQYAFERLLDDSAPHGMGLPRKYHPETGWEWLSTDELEKFRGALKEHAGIIGQELGQEAQHATGRHTGKSLLHLFEAYEKEILEHFIPTPADPAASVRQAYERFNLTDALTFPLELMGGLREKDVIEAIRLSPHDARKGFSVRDARSKLSGDMAGNFGGFFKRSWRANDILWGQLDGVCQLVELLFTSERLKRLTSNEGTLNTLRERLLKAPDAEPGSLREEYDPAMLFRLAGKETHQRLSQWIQQLLSKDKQVRDAALSQAAFLEMKELLIEAAQLEVLGTELENVLADSREELASWKRLKLVRGKEAEELESKLAHMENQFTQSRESDTSTAHRPADTALGRFFKEDYQVGAEEFLRAIPHLVLLDITSAALPVLRNGLVRIFKTRAAGIMRVALRFGILATQGARVFIKIQQSAWFPSFPSALIPRWARRVTPQALPMATSASLLHGGAASSERRQIPVLSRLWRPVRDLWSRSRLPPKAEPRAG